MTSITSEQFHDHEKPVTRSKLLVKFLLVSLLLHLALLALKDSPDQATSTSQSTMYVNLTPAPEPAEIPVAEPPKPVEPAPAQEPIAPEPVAEEPTPVEPEPAPEPSPEPQPATEEVSPPAETSAPIVPADIPAGFRSQNELFQEVVPEFMKHYLYPAKARTYNIQGVVSIGYTIMPDGSITDIQIVESSGHEILDVNTIFIMQRVRISPLPPGQGPQTMVIRIPYPMPGQ